MMKEKVPIYQKQNLTLEEAAEYSNIGINRLTMLIKEPTCNFVLYVGNKRLIKRKLFDEFIENINMI
ncbi:MAG: hypothetical protein DBY41_08905 [Clostridium sp.]|nr:MAG: hypothetical protein DBY41_08905 [Clostridium sp.]